jgi:hypothetical protein
MITIYDNFITPEKCVEFYKYCTKLSYSYGETDHEESPPVGLACDLNSKNEWVEFFVEQVKNKFSLHNVVDRCYINLFLPGERPYYHTDGEEDEITFLYYANIEWDLDEGGETKFVVGDKNEEIRGVLPIPNRAIIFPANMIHSASSFRTKARYSLAIKYCSLDISL